MVNKRVGSIGGVSLSAKKQSVFVCSNCGKQSVWKIDFCPNCNQSGTYIPYERPETAEKKQAKHVTVRNPTGVKASQPLLITDVSLDSTDRWSTTIDEFDRVLGGGIVPGSLILIGGQPGAGKSTLVLAAASAMSQSIGTVLYVSGEESEKQIRMRAERLGIEPGQLYLVYETDIDIILNNHVTQIKPHILIIDSISTMTSKEINAASGSPSQVKYATTQIQKLAKSTGIAVFMIGHVTKEGLVAGPNALAHDVDAVLYLEGDQHNIFRLLRSQKNRFGNAGEVGVFEMAERGLIEVPNPSEAFLAERAANKPGGSIAITMEGSRPIIVEIQALCASSNTSNPARRSTGLSRDRAFLVAAVLDKHIRSIDLFDTDLFISVVGGMSITEPAADISIALAIMSSWHRVPVPGDLAAIGEVSLTGDLRSVMQLELRLREAANLGFRRVIIPPIRRNNISRPDGLEIIECRTLEDVMRVAFSDEIDFDDDAAHIIHGETITPRRRRETPQSDDFTVPDRAYTPADYIPDDYPENAVQIEQGYEIEIEA